MADAYSGGGALLPTGGGASVLTPRQARDVDRRTRDQAAIDAAMRNEELVRGQALKQAAIESQRALAEAEERRMHDPQAYAAGTIGASDDEFGQAFSALGQRAPSYRVPRFGYEETKRYTDTMGQLVGEAPALMAQRQDAELRQAIAQRDVTAEMAAQQAQLVEGARQRAQSEAHRVAAARDMVDRTQQLSRKAADEFAKSADTDSANWFARQGVGTQIAAALGAGLLGFGGMDPFAGIRAAIQDEQNDVMSRRERLRASAQMAGEGVGEARSLYNDLLSQIGDERVAALAHENAIMGGLQQQMATRLQTAGIRTMNAEQQQLFNQFAQQIADNERQIGLLAAGNTPTRVVGGGPKYNADQRRLLGKAADASLRDRSAARAAIGSAAVEEQKDQRKFAAEAAAGPSTQDKKLASHERQTLIDRTADIREELTQLKQWREKYSNEIPGFIWGRGWNNEDPDILRSGESVKAYEELFRAVRKRLRRESGAAIPESEIVEEAHAALRGSGSEDDVRADVDRRIAEAERLIDFYERGPDEASVAEVNRSQAGDRKSFASGGVGLTDPVAWEEDE